MRPCRAIRSNRGTVALFFSQDEDPCACPATSCIDDDLCCNRDVGCNSENDNDCEEIVPTVSSWGLLVLALLLGVGAKLYFGGKGSSIVVATIAEAVHRPSKLLPKFGPETAFSTQETLVGCARVI